MSKKRTDTPHRVLLRVEYDGTAYAGWQRQLNGLAVQQVLEEALSSCCGHPVTVTGASRTDAGVHAADQAVHFDTVSTIPADKYPFVLNNILPPDIRVQSGRDVPAGFHARFMTNGKQYTYRILNSRHGSAIRRDTWVHVPVPLAEEPIRRAVSTLLGTHDFAAFQAAGGTAKTTVRTIRRAELLRSGDEFSLIIEGDAFLYNMVRIIAGTLIEIGHGKLLPDAFEKAFISRNRLDLGPTAPPHGLELTKVSYSDRAFTDPASVRWHQEAAEGSEDEP